MNIPEQFTVKAHPTLFEGEEGRKKLRNTFQRLRPEEFSSGDFGLRSLRRSEPLPKYFCFHYYRINIPEQFTVMAHPTEWEGEGRSKKIEEHFPEASA